LRTTLSLATVALLAACQSAPPAATAAAPASTAAAAPPAWQQGRSPDQAGSTLAPVAGKLTMKMYRDKPDPGRDTAMSAALHGLKDADLQALAHYLSQRVP
jgi:hypothetical protein